MASAPRAGRCLGLLPSSPLLGSGNSRSGQRAATAIYAVSIPSADALPPASSPRDINIHAIWPRVCFLRGTQPSMVCKW